MAGVKFSAQTPEIATGTSKKTIVQVEAAANHRVLVKEISVSFTGISNTALPINVQVLRQTDAGTMSALTLSKRNESDSETIQTTGTQAASAEPTGTDEVMGEETHPQGGFIWQAPFDDPIIIQGGDRLGVAVTAAADVNAKARMVCEE